jgi:hypothetical protein
MFSLDLRLTGPSSHEFIYSNLFNIILHQIILLRLDLCHLYYYKKLEDEFLIYEST